MPDLKDEIGKLRAQLLDMGKNNNLVNYQYLDDRSIRLIDTKPEDVFRMLVLEGAGPRIISSKAVNISEDDLKGNSSQTDIDRKLERMIRRYYEDYENLGYTTVFVAMGFLSWKTNTNNKAPIVLMPAKLRRNDSGNVCISWNGDDVRVSPTFMEKLRELNIRIPDQEPIESLEALEKCFETMSTAIDGRIGFKISSGVVIDTFDFSKSVMYNDIDPANWPEIPELVQRIMDPSLNGKEQATERRIPSCTYSILDGDSSQMSVVMDVLEGRSVVVEGPPGTGKSQTISNIISECLGNGKTVLFVSEKMAALNVVKRRLNEAGLASYIMELHSDNMNRKNFLREMERSMSREQILDAPSDSECSRLERIRGDLDAYADAVSQPIGDRGFTPYQLIGMRDVALGNIKRRKRVPVRIEIKEPLSIDDKAWDDCIDLLRTASELIPQVMPIKKNPWKDCDVRNLTPDREYAFRDHMFNISKRMEDIQAASKDVCKVLGVPVPQTLGEYIALDKECKNILRLGSISLRDMEGDADEYMMAADAVIRDLNDIQTMRATILKKYRTGIFEVDAAGNYDEFIRSKKTLLKKTYKDMKKVFDKNAFSTNLSEESMEKDFVTLADYQKKLKEFDPTDKDNLFGEKWNGIDSKVEVLKNIRDWTVSVKRNRTSGRFTDTTALIISRGGNGSPLESIYKEMGDNITSLLRSMDGIMDILGMDPEDVFEKGYNELKPAGVKKWLKDLNSNMDTLRPWANYCDMMEKFAISPINDLGKKASNGDINALDIMDTFLVGYTGALIASAVETRPSLRDFSYELREIWVKDFSDLDVSLLKTNCERLRKRLMTISEEKMEQEEEGIRILKGEFNRGNGQMSVRKIMNLAGPAIQAVKPCFMMSPLSVAQYLANKEIRFDVVIFDEASQVLPADSLGTLLRGRQAVIMGDSKQLPPTIFFEKKEEGSSDAATPRDMESLLNLCRASLPVRVLSWHYRSKHSSLMALSNRLFYDDKLMVCPSPFPAPPHMGLKLRYVRTAVYERGATGTNPKEAKMIARAVWHHYIETPEKSLGVATFNINQQKAITEEVEKMFRRHADARANMMLNTTEPLIIRNLESIQGDERDVMFVSVGYGYDTDGKLSKSFGALNRAGGERRLNVLMTRAREQCIMFSNFKSMDMGIRENAPEGVNALQAYLEYAEFGHTSKLDSPPIKDDLVESIGTFLASKGVKTSINVGSSGFRIDVAVCSPEDPSTYIMGICLDGRTYQNMKYTRDRDRTFTSMLQRMGWNTYRIWSMDWYANPESSKKRLWSRVSGALAKVASRPAADPEMFSLVSELVEKWSPIHKDMLQFKVKEAKKVPTVSAKMRNEIADAVAAAITLGRFEEKDNFLLVPGRPIFPRIRNKDEKWKPEWVHPEEYIKALKESVDIELNEDQIIAAALQRLGLPDHKVFREEARTYLGIE